MPASNYANVVALSISLTASGAVTLERFIKPSGAACGLGELACGVASKTAATTKDVSAYTGYVRILAGDTVTIGTWVMSDADGKAIPYAAGGSGTDYQKLALAMTAGTSDNIMKILTMF